MSVKGWLQHMNQAAPNAKALFLSTDQLGFVAAAERLIAGVVARMERSRATYRKLNEEDLSNLIVEMLGAGVPSSAESRSNGHVDVTIRHPRDAAVPHLTECKIWSGYTWHRKGMEQLLSDPGYATWREGRVLCLAFFIRHKRMGFLLRRLRDRLDDRSTPPDVEDHPFLSEAFISRHQHANGRKLGITHLGCFLWQDGDPDLDEADDPPCEGETA